MSSVMLNIHKAHCPNDILRHILNYQLKMACYSCNDLYFDLLKPVITSIYETEQLIKLC